MPPRKWYDPKDPFGEAPIPDKVNSDEVKIEGSDSPVHSSVKEPTNDEIAKAPRPTKVYDRTNWSNTNNLDYEVSLMAGRSDIDAYKRVENRRQRRERTVAPATAKKRASTIARTSSAESAASSRSYTPSTSSSASSPARSKRGKVDYYKADRATRRKMEQERIAGVAKRANEWARNTRNYSNEPKSTNWSQTPEGKDRQARIRQRNLAEANRTIADENRYNTQNMDDLTGAATAGASLLPGFLAARGAAIAGRSGLSAARKAAPVLVHGARTVASAIPRLASRARRAANQAAPRVGSTPQSNPGVPITRSSSPGPTIRRPSPTPSTPTAPATRGNSPRPTIRRPASSPSTPSSSAPTTRSTPTRPTLRKPTSGSSTSTTSTAPSGSSTRGNTTNPSNPTTRKRASTSSSPNPPTSRNRPPKPASKRGKP